MDKKLYSQYVSTHTKNIYGDVNVNSITSQFNTWDSYFGEYISANKNINILDVGCGNGGLVYWLQKMGYGNSQGIDISDEQIAIAKELGIKNIEHGDAEIFLEKNKDKFDIIFARDVLEHFPKEKVIPLLENILGALRPGGIFIGQTVNAENWLWGRLRHGDFTHEVAFTSSSIRQVLKVAGFGEIKVHPQRPVIHGVKSLVRSMLWMFWEGLSRLLLIIETGSSVGIFTQNLIVVAKKS